ncbi:MAG TPA: M64 family metallopeptidase, partial [Vicinamibacteria bacterium]
VWAVQESGPPRDKVDLLLLGDGYAAGEMDKWHRDARRLAETLFAESPFKERRSDFNVWAVDSPAELSGVSRPSDAVFRRSPLRASYDAFGSERYVLAFDDRWRELAAFAPYEFVEIVVNERKYGGGGIYNLYATVAADNAFTPYVFVHEFGHHFAGLADEYYTSDVAYATGQERVEPWEPNATADPRAVKWKSLMAASAPLPTPWPKAEFEEIQKEIQARRRKIRAEGRPEAEMEALFREESARTAPLLAQGPHAAALGAFEGALYEASGYYRPRADCIMFTRNPVGFCPVCRRGIERVVDLYARPRVQSR